MLHRGGLIYAGVRDPAGLSDEFDGLPAEVIPLDVTDLATVQAAAADCPEVNLLVNNAGLFTNKRLVLTDDPAAARREMEVNYCRWPAPSRRRSWAAIPRPRRRRSSCPASPGPSWPIRAPR
jgi:NAD(P)-dependent dehydrogenase (short-subunit alcohol dehydrogenase family)